MEGACYDAMLVPATSACRSTVPMIPPTTGVIVAHMAKAGMQAQHAPHGRIDPIATSQVASSQNTRYVFLDTVSPSGWWFAAKRSAWGRHRLFQRDPPM